jgi:pimeloyl-ACP methyl ester carboxylesterase
MPSKRVTFQNQSGTTLAGIIDWPDDAPQAFGVFSHCFTCSKDLKAIVRISRGLAAQGIAMLRFDFQGLGESEGSFSDSNFSTTIEDVQSAVDFLSESHAAPVLLIGHSLGGAAMMVKASSVPSARGLVTIAAPSSTQHLADFLAGQNADIMSKGEGVVEIGGRSHRLQRQLIDDLRGFDLEPSIRKINVPHMIIHPPEDKTLPYWHAEKLCEFTGGAKTLITLDGSDHLLVKQPGDVGYVATLIGAWIKRQLA